MPVGTDVRKLVYDGYPATSVLGCDLRQDYIDLGYKLYGDKEASQICSFTSDIFDLPPSFNNAAVHGNDAKITTLSQLLGSLTHVYTGALLHLFDEST